MAAEVFCQRRSEVFHCEGTRNARDKGVRKGRKKNRGRACAGGGRRGLRRGFSWRDGGLLRNALAGAFHLDTGDGNVSRVVPAALSRKSSCNGVTPQRGREKGLLNHGGHGGGTEETTEHTEHAEWVDGIL